MSVTGYVNASNQKSFQLTTYDKINSAPSQAKYTFSKANRFPSIKTGSDVASYELPSQKSPRGAGIGIGGRDVFSDKRKSPSPDKYRIGSTFDKRDDSNKKSLFGEPHKTFCFGAGRENFTKTVYNPGVIVADAVVPGPGTYTDETKLIGVNARKTTLKERKFYMEVEYKARKLAIPGPGSYNDAQALSKTGEYISSQMVNSKAARMNTGRRFRDDSKLQPGPGDYENTGNIASGTQACTNFHSTITKNMRTTEKKSQWGGNPRFRTPGPGTYRPPSDFGYLEFKNTLRDQNRSIVSGYDQSMMDNKLEQTNMSMMSDKKSRRSRHNNSMFRTVDAKETNRMFAKRQSADPAHQSSRNFVTTQQSTLYSVENSMGESPRVGQKMHTPMTTNVNRSTGLDSQLRVSPRENANGQKFIKAKRGSNVPEMVSIYADVGSKQQRQQAVAAQIRQKFQEDKQNKNNPKHPPVISGGSTMQVIDQTPRNASELGYKPNTILDTQ